MQFPTFRYERELASRGYFAIGVDEVGCGCLAGPVVAAAVHLPLDVRIPGIADSKLLSPQRREQIVAEFFNRGILWSVGLATSREVDRLNVRKATYLAMERACAAFLQVVPEFSAQVFSEKKPFALIDAWTLPNLTIGQQGIIHGDRLVRSIAAASILAKVVRDRLMKEYDRDFPGYGFAVHKGYGTFFHRRAIGRFGVTPLHRRSFQFKKV